MITQVKFLNLFNQNESYLRKFSRHLTTNDVDAQDLFQETAVRLFSNQEKFKTGSNFVGWSKLVMKNLYINDWRRKKICPFKYAEPSTLSNYSTISVLNNGESLLNLAYIKEKISQLPKKYRTPFALYQQGLRYEEIAKELNIPLGSVKSRIFHARAFLKKRLVKIYYA